MVDQERMQVKKFQPDDMLYIVGNNEENAANARLNQVAGPAYSYFLDGKLVGCGGVRIAGVGEAWAAYTPEALEHKSGLLLHSRTTLDQIKRDEHLWRMWSESPEAEPNQNFLKHLNFSEVKAFLRG